MRHPAHVAALITAAGIQTPPGRRASRLHDLRHVFAVATMLDWYRDGDNAQARLPACPPASATSIRNPPTVMCRAVPGMPALAAVRIEQTAGQAGSLMTDLARTASLQPGQRSVPIGHDDRPASRITVLRVCVSVTA